MVWPFTQKIFHTLNNPCYEGILFNQFGQSNSPWFHSLTSSIYEVLIVIDNEGIAALSWDNILWKKKFEGANSGYLELITINDSHVIVKQDLPNYLGGFFCLTFDIHTGQLEKRWESES